MATKPKKAPAKVEQKKKAEKKQTVKVEKGAAITSTLGGVVFEVSAVIPTQAYGNIQPRVQIVCSTVEEGRGIVMPLIESLFEQYAETRPTFLGKVVETVKTVAPAPVEAVKAPEATTPPQAPAVDVPAPQATASAAPERPKSESVKKAEKMISLANSPEAILKIQGQIENSVKLTAEEKPALLNLVLKRRGELK